MRIYVFWRLNAYIIPVFTKLFHNFLDILIRGEVHPAIFDPNAYLFADLLVLIPNN